MVYCAHAGFLSHGRINNIFWIRRQSGGGGRGECCWASLRSALLQPHSAERLSENANCWAQSSRTEDPQTNAAPVSKSPGQWRRCSFFFFFRSWPGYNWWNISSWLILDLKKKTCILTCLWKYIVSFQIHKCIIYKGAIAQGSPSSSRKVHTLSVCWPLFQPSRSSPDPIYFLEFSDKDCAFFMEWMD